jgi:elongation factor P--(R)-beta-lysine ligase
VSESERARLRRVLPRLRSRARALRAIRAYFDEEGFLEVETPLAVPSPGLDLHLAAFEVRGFGDPRWLITSPEYQMKRLLAGGSGPIFQLARCFRRDERGHLHEPEFTLLEWYRPDADAEAVMADTERLVARAAEALNGAPTAPGPDGPVDLRGPWPRYTVEALFAEHVGAPALALDEEAFYRAWVEHVEPALGPAPCFVTRWPASMASLARLCEDDPRWADRFEAYGGAVELCNGFGELTDPVEQRQRLERDRAARAAQGLEDYPIDERFLAALEEGLPPSGGNALGVDRLLMWLTGAPCIQDVMAMPDERV